MYRPVVDILLSVNNGLETPQTPVYDPRKEGETFHAVTLQTVIDSH